MTLLERLKKYGRNSNSFLTLYDGFKHLESSSGDASVAYVETGRNWIAATEPLAPDETSLDVLEEFRNTARASGRGIMMLPVSEEFATKARAKGLKTMMIGSEPIFELDRFIPSFDKFHSSKHLHATGARIEVLQFNQMAPELRAECQEILDEWLDLRWMAPLSFLNRVNPWEQAEHKSFFMLRYHGRCLAFLAAIPIWPSGGWYFVDLLRRRDAPPGTTEMLLMEAMRLVKQAGSSWVSLGLSPLSRLEESSWDQNPKLYRILNLIYNHGNAFYRFKPLYEFKAKLGPTSFPKRYLIYSSKSLSIGDVLSLTHAMTPGGVLEMAWSGIRKKLRLDHLYKLITPRLRIDVVTRAFPQNVNSLFQRLRFTSVVVLFSVAGSLISNSLMKKQFGFSWNHLLSAPLQTVLISPWMHRNPVHLFINLAFTLTFVACFELLCGTRTTLKIFIAGALLSNPITLALLSLMLPRAQWSELNDIGISLGIFSCVGALGYLFRSRRIFILLVQSAVILVAALTQDWMQLNHITALWIGVFAMRSLLDNWNIPQPHLKKWRIGFRSFSLLLALVGCLASGESRAGEWALLPENRHEQYQTYAFFQEEQTGLFVRTGGRAWGMAGGTFALLEDSASSWNPQLVAFAGGNFAYRMNGLGVLTETFDARVGVHLDCEPAEGHRLSLSWVHFSGHISDDVEDKDLIGPNLGWEAIWIRYIYTRPEHFRLGATLKPFYSWDPSVKPWASDQFVEWYPIGLSNDRRQASPYISAGLEQYGVSSVVLTEQVQAGLLFGNHSRPVHEQSFRIAAGYYNGVDPRLKYAAFKNSKVQFGYFGVFIDL